MAFAYQITYTPGKYYVAPAVSSQGVKYWNVINEATRQPVAYAFTENESQSICLALDLLNAMVSGDRTRVRELGKLIDKLKQ
jgi:hypothetical protein